MTDLWDIAAEEVEFEQHQARFHACIQTLASVRPFLAAAEDDLDYENRMAMVDEQIDAVVATVAEGVDFAVLKADVVASLSEEFERTHRQKVAEIQRLTQHRNKLRAWQRNEARRKEAEGRHSETCPKCGAHMTEVYVNSENTKLTAECSSCGWKGGKSKTAARFRLVDNSGVIQEYEGGSEPSWLYEGQRGFPERRIQIQVDGNWVDWYEHKTSATHRCVYAGDESKGSCSSDLFEVWSGRPEPTYLCGKHEQQWGIPQPTKAAKGVTAGKVTCNSCGNVTNRQEALDRCPKCKSSDLRRDVGYPRISSTAIWNATPWEKTAGETPPQFQKKDEEAKPAEGEAPVEGEEKPAEEGEDAAPAQEGVGADGAPPPPAIQEKIEEANSVSPQAPVDPNAQQQPAPEQQAPPAQEEEKKPDFLKKEQSLRCPTCNTSISEGEQSGGSTIQAGDKCPDCGNGTLTKDARFKLAEFPPKKDEAKPEGEGMPTEQEDQNDPGQRIDALRGIVEKHQATTIDGYLVDATTANLLCAIYDGLNPDNQAKFETIELARLVDWAWKRTGKVAADAAPDGCIGCIVMGGTPVVVKAGCPVHDTDKEASLRTQANPYTTQNPYANPATDVEMGRRKDTQGTPDEMLDGPNDMNLMKDVAPQSTKPRQRPGGQPTEFNPTAPQTVTTSSLGEIPVICHGCKQTGLLALSRLSEADLRCVCGSDDLDVFEKEAISGDLPFGQVAPEADTTVKQDVRCSSCLSEYVVNTTNPSQPLPPCPNCGSEAVSAAGATGVSPTASYVLTNSNSTSGWVNTTTGSAANVTYTVVPSFTTTAAETHCPYCKQEGCSPNCPGPQGRVTCPGCGGTAHKNDGKVTCDQCGYGKPGKGFDDNSHNASKTAADDIGPNSGGFIAWLTAMWGALQAGSGKIPSWFPKSLLLPEEVQSGHFIRGGGPPNAWAASKRANALDDDIEHGYYRRDEICPYCNFIGSNAQVADHIEKAGPEHQAEGTVTDQMNKRLNAVKKIAEIADGVLTTNPGMTRDAAIAVAIETVAKYPKVAGLK